MKKKLLNYYEHHLNVIKKRKKGFKWNRDYCYSKFIQDGLCICSREVFKELIDSTRWIKNNIPEYSNYWYKCVCQTNTTKELIDCLEFRINKLKQLINTTK